MFHSTSSLFQFTKCKRIFVQFCFVLFNIDSNQNINICIQIKNWTNLFFFFFFDMPTFKNNRSANLIVFEDRWRDGVKTMVPHGMC